MDLARVDVAYALILDQAQERVLMVEESGTWCIPGGGREYGEMLHQAAVREAREESGFDITVGDIVHISEKIFESEHVLFVTFRGEIVGGQLGSDDPEIGGIEWKPIDEAERLMPFYRNIRGLYRQTVPYMVQASEVAD